MIHSTLKGLNKLKPMSTYTQILYQIVFSTKQREQVLEKEKRPELFKYVWGILNKSNCHLYRLNGVEDHLHIVTHLHPSVSLADLVKNKIASSGFIKDNGIFKHFIGWQDGYGAFTYSIKEKSRLIEYVKNQEEHHKTITFMDEYIELLKEHEIEFDEKYLL
jgi:putative transposase